MNTNNDHAATKIVIGCILFFVLFSMSSTFYEWNARVRIRPERFFELVHNFPTDYNLYLSRIREGKEGSWLATEKYTSEPHAGSLSQILYVFIGRLADNAHVQTPYVWFAYHVARVFFAALLLWVIWKVAAWIFSSFVPRSGTSEDRSLFFWQFLAFLLVVTQSTWPKFELVSGIPRLGGWMPWYTQADSLQRTTFMPHVLLAQAMFIFIFWVLSGGFTTKKLPGNYVFLGIVGLVLGIIFPPGLLFIYGVIGFVCIGELVAIFKNQNRFPNRSGMTRIKEWFFRDLFGRFVFGVVTAPSFVYFMLLLSQYPWKRLTEFDVLHPTAFSFVEYFMAMGPVLPFGLLAIVFIVILRRWQVLSQLKFFVAWVVAWLVFLFVFDKIPAQSPTRFTQMAPQVPLGILSAYLFYEVYQFIHTLRINKISGEQKVVSSKQKGKQKSWYFPFLLSTICCLPIIIILLGLGTMASSYMWMKDFVDHKLRATIPLVPHGADVMYPLYDIIDAVTWLQINTPRSAIVLSGLTTGNYIPVYSGNTVVVGHANTVQLEIKLAAMENFYNKRRPFEEEWAWLHDQHISYIMYGPEEFEISGGLGDLRTLYPALVEVFKNNSVRIYHVP